MPRLPCGVFVALLLFTACATEPARSELAPLPPPPPDQILWQRTLEDALAIAKLRHQPLLLAINMDGESASDRIYTERYRDPAFVAATRHCVCLGASVFRHNARDHDDQGRRIPCPRFGEITCGEHIALEPVLFEKYLADGDRVAPRHALILPDGSKAWDLSLCFDLKDIDRALLASVQGLKDANDAPIECEHRQRLAFEDHMAESARALWLKGLTEHGDPAAGDALRRLLPRLRSRSAASIDVEAIELFYSRAVVACGLAESIGGDVWKELQSAEGPRAEVLLATLTELVEAAPSLRLQLHAYRALTFKDAPSFASLLAQADAVTKRLAGAPPVVRPTGDEMPAADVLERELEEVESLLAKNADDAVLHARFAKASLDLGRQHLDAGKKDARLLLEDAAAHFKKAIARDAHHDEWLIESARTAYFLGDFAGEAEFGRRALALAQASADATLPTDATQLDARTAEALRWIGDGQARRLGELAPDASDAATVVREAVLALALVAASEHAYANDWIGLASVCDRPLLARTLSCWRAELQVGEAGALRFPASPEIRGAIGNALWNTGRIDLAPVVSARIAERAPVAESFWFTGQAWIAVAEDRRRRDDASGAIAAYTAAIEQFAATAAKGPAFADDCRQRVASCWFGRGMALARTADRAGALDGLAQAIGSGADVASMRDGLGYDALDLVDRILEWRESGPSPVTATALFDRVAAAAPGAPFWPNAIADAAIREALRADGRNPQRVEKETVDAGGRPIRMPMGLPTALGDAWLRDAIAIARRAQAGDASPELDQDRKTTFAQACTLWAERQLERNQLDGVREALTDAAQVLGLAAPAADASTDALRQLAAQARAAIGPARLKLRDGR